jgi:hypothetical protein
MQSLFRDEHHGMNTRTPTWEIFRIRLERIEKVANLSRQPGGVFSIRGRSSGEKECAKIIHGMTMAYVDQVADA